MDGATVPKRESHPRVASIFLLTSSCATRPVVETPMLKRVTVVGFILVGVLGGCAGNGPTNAPAAATATRSVTVTATRAVTRTPTEIPTAVPTSTPSAGPSVTETLVPSPTTTLVPS